MNIDRSDDVQLFTSFQEYRDFVSSKKNAKRLHSVAEQRLQSLLKYLHPDAYPASEVGGVLGGRNDMMQFFFNGRRVVFELFFSPSQVPQDLRLLEQCSADVKIAILLDYEIDPKLSDEYFHKKPDHFPFLWLKQLFLKDREVECMARLQELIDEDAPVIQLRRILSTPVGKHIGHQLVEQFQKLERQLGINPNTAPKLEELSLADLIVMYIISRINKLGVPANRLRGLKAWLDNSIEHGIHLVVAGFQAFLITNLDGRHAIWSDGDLADDLILGAERDDNAYVVMCLNKVINDFWEVVHLPRKELDWHFFHTYREHIGKIIPRWGMETQTEADEN